MSSDTDKVSKSEIFSCKSALKCNILSAPYHKAIQVISVVAIAQLVEPRIVIPVVEGSSPFSHPILLYVNILKVEKSVISAAW